MYNSLKPSFFIAGVPKAGTTALHEYLSKHPQVAMSRDKEPNYFSWQEIEQQQLYYRKKNIKTEEEYLNLFNTNTNALIAGEASISYLFYPESAKRINAFQPDAKIIISLREPVSRTVSHYQMDYSLGLVTTDLETIWRQGKNHPKTGLYYQQYFQLSEYFHQVENYLQVFSKEKMLIFLHEELIEDQSRCLKKLCDFLKIDFNLAPLEISSRNVTLAGKNKVVRYLYSNDFVRKGLSLLTNESVKSTVKKLLFTKSKFPEIRAAFKSELKSHYQSDLINLERITGLNLNKWYQ